MNKNLAQILAAGCLSATLCHVSGQIASSAIQLNVRWNGANLEASWPAKALRGDGTVAFPSFELQRSGDLKKWSAVGGPAQGAEGGGIFLSAQLPVSGGAEFYRLSARFSPVERASMLAAGGAQVFGYADAFAEELAAIGLITPEQFSARYPAPSNYLAALDWDPTTADFWAEFNISPEEYNATLIPGVDDLRSYDFRLNDNELALFKKNGFVVSERMGAASCGEILARLWEDDLPVYIAPDPILYAWHRNYDMMLSELEETYLFENLRQMLEGMASKVSEAATQAGDGPLKDSVRDADYLVTVARSLLAGVPEVSALGQNDRVAVTLAAVERLQLENCFDLFGRPRAVDFSQFKPRGHYTESERLSRYFKCVKWLGRTDLRVAGGPYRDAFCAEPQNAPPRELGTAIVLNQLLNTSGQFSRWQQFDNMIQTFVGWTDSLTFSQLGEVLRAAGVQTVTDVPDVATLERVQADLVRGDIGVKNIRSDWMASPLGGEQMTLPQSFTIFGQKFILDGWVHSQTVYDSIVWDEDGIPSAGDKVQRRVPSALDVAFSVFGNDQIVPELVSRITDRSPSRHLFRDGLNYQHNLAAARGVVDKHPASAWNQNLYMGWLSALRELSAPVTDAIYPDAVRTRAWAMKDLNAQLVSWTHMRHDTILYAAQPYTGCQCACSYPAGFVEPRPVFWRGLRQMADTAANLIQASDYSGSFQVESFPGSGNFTEVSLQTLQTRQVRSFQKFSEVAGTLQEMSERELRQEPFTPAQSDFLQNTMVAQLVSGYNGRWWEVHDGWYPKLFYRPLAQEAPPGLPPEALSENEGAFQFTAGALRWDALVADVHTDVPCLDCPIPDPGSVLHQATGRAQLLMIAINNGPDRRVYAGPVMSHYEFELTGPPQRLSDPEWKQRWAEAGFDSWFANPTGDWSKIPAQPDWTRGYLVPYDRQ